MFPHLKPQNIPKTNTNPNFPEVNSKTFEFSEKKIKRKWEIMKRKKYLKKNQTITKHAVSYN